MSARRSVRMESKMMSGASSPKPTPAALASVVGIDIGMESCLMCCLTMEKRQIIKPSQFSHDARGFDWLFGHLKSLRVAPNQILVGLEATSRDAREPLSCLAQSRIPCVLVASRADPRLCATTGSACENRSRGCDD